MEPSRIGGGLLAGVAVAAPWIADMMGLTVPPLVGWALLGLCAFAFVSGLLLLWPRKKSAEVDKGEPPASTTFDIEGGKGVTLEDNQSTAARFASVRNVEGFSARDNRHDPAKKDRTPKS